MQTRYDIIEELRELDNLSKNEISRKMGYSKCWYSYHLNNGTLLTAEHLKKLAKILGCTFEYLTGTSDKVKETNINKKHNKKYCYNEKCVYMSNSNGVKYCPFRGCLNNG